MYKYIFYTHQGQTVFPRISDKESHLANRIQLHNLLEYLLIKLFQHLHHNFRFFFSKKNPLKQDDLPKRKSLYLGC